MKNRRIVSNAIRVFLLGAVICWSGSQLRAENGPVEAELIAEAVQVAPGEDLRVGVRLEIAEGWYVFGQTPGLVGLPTEVSWDLPDGVTVEELRFPEPEIIEVEGEREFGYSGDIFITTTLRLPDELEDVLTVGAKVSWLAFGDRWLPGESELRISLPIGDQVVWSEAHQELFGEREPMEVAAEREAPLRRPLTVGGLLLFGLFGFIGGFLLNLMPCVLPVIGVKIMSVVKSSGDDPRTILLQGWMYTAGIVVSFWILAGVVIALQAAGQALGQGFQFQHLPFLVFVTALIFILALSMLGVFSVGLTSGGYEKASKLSGRQGLSGAFFTGFVVTAVATPCTAPFLGAAMGFAFTQPALVTVAVFTAVGLGLAFPFTLLAHRPQWLKFLPKPGMWMEYFKQLMGFLMMGAVVWLLWVINLSQGGDAVVWTVAFLFVLGIAGWVFGTFGNAAKPRAVRRRAWVMIAVLLAGGFAGILEGQLKWRETGTADRTTGAGEEGSGRIAWVDFTPEKLDELLETDQPVFVNFTAAWCLSCKVNERTSIEIPATQSVKEQTNAVFVYGDWTNQNPEIAAFLRRHDRAGVPLYLVYGRDRDNPRLLPEILTPGTMERALRWAAETFEEDS
jgi:thiol:disulfide interchange protein